MQSITNKYIFTLIVCRKFLESFVKELLEHLQLPQQVNSSKLIMGCAGLLVMKFINCHFSLGACLCKVIVEGVPCCLAAVVIASITVNAMNH
jgi:hypothetical protein